jgi:predicted ribosomally synthesized peptide with SipW-like signal peptide
MLQIWTLTGQERMKKILKSLSLIAVVAAIAIGGTVAYFSDTEESTNNVISAGTIDIAVDTENPWVSNAQYSFTGLEPSDDRDIDVVLSNVGTNDVVIWKKVSVTAEADNLQSEPECFAEGGAWDQSASLGNQCTGQTLANRDAISTQFVYSMNIGGNVDINQAWDVRVSDVNDLWIPIGRLNTGQTLAVDQNYYFDEMAGNAYQGDSMTLDITFYAEQLDASGPTNTTRGVVLENKNASGDWAPIIADGTWGIMTWNGTAYTVRAWGLAGASYRVAHYNEATATQTLMDDTLTPVSAAISDTGTLTATGADSKYWLRDLSWNNDNTLWEANLVTN